MKNCNEFIIKRALKNNALYNKNGKIYIFVAIIFMLTLSATGDESTLYKDSSKSGAYRGHRSSRWAEIKGDTFGIYMNKGFEAYMNNDIDQALEMYSVAAKIKRRNTYLAYSNRANIYLSRGQYDLAIDDYTEVLKLRPNELSAYLSRGNVWLAKGQTDKAIEDFSKAIDANPKYAGAYVCRGKLWCKNGELDKAHTDFSKATELDNNSPETLIPMARFLSTCPEEKYRNGNQAVELTRKAIQITHNWEGMAKRQKSSEVMTYERLPLAPQYDTLASAYAETGNFAEAIANQQKAISLLANENSNHYFQAFSEHLKLYQEMKPLRETSN
ncbi:MAG: tetratricopeptide repeat protein [Proteobacteria bacterium]|nr:tetratricopeptide repeat protein [Pseudomonadota bacterium]MBU4469660.1 tetratricopeptide repeat protein [Pseudomonadota bacterium]MCG2751743.1 tetratricopeptide repeat protein [Desulfobacteraceae bacterium]